MQYLCLSMFRNYLNLAEYNIPTCTLSRYMYYRSEHRVSSETSRVFDLLDFYIIRALFFCAFQEIAIYKLI